MMFRWLLSKMRYEEEAIQRYDKIIETYRKNPPRPWISSNKAIKFYDKAIKKNPNNADLWYNKGLFLCLHNDKVEALKYYDKIIEINPNHAKAWIKKGLIHDQLGSLTEAIKCYDKAIEINSNYENNSAEADVWLHLCYALALLPMRWPNTEGKRERLSKALDCINKAIEYSSKYAGNPYIWTNKGMILWVLGSYDEEALKKCYDKAIEIDPNYEKHEVLSFDGPFLGNIVNEWW
jgi:tetratricopeptide (TPR) repeat protein